MNEKLSRGNQYMEFAICIETLLRVSFVNDLMCTLITPCASITTCAKTVPKWSLLQLKVIQLKWKRIYIFQLPEMI